MATNGQGSPITIDVYSHVELELHYQRSFLHIQTHILHSNLALGQA